MIDFFIFAVWKPPHFLMKKDNFSFKSNLTVSNDFNLLFISSDLVFIDIYQVLVYYIGMIEFAQFFAQNNLWSLKMKKMDFLTK